MSETPYLRHLDPKVKWVWFIPPAAVLLVLWLAVLVALFVGGVDSPFSGLSRTAFAGGLFLFIALFVAGPIYAYNHIEYMSFTYELAPKEIIIRQGVFTRQTAVIPYARIQNINTQRTVLERLMGLASLGIDTAGTNPNMSEGLLPGVSKKDELIREIMDRVEKEKARGDGSAERSGGLGGAGAGASSSASSASAGLDGLPSEKQLLSDILKELVQLKHLLQQRESASPTRPSIPPAHSPETWSRRAPAPPSHHPNHTRE